MGTGLTGSYYNTNNLSGNVVLTRIEAVNFGWGTASPGTGVNADNFSVRWSGTVLAPTTGAYRFRTVSDDGIRLWVNGVQLINNWNAHSSTTRTSGTINLTAGIRYSVTVEFFEGAVDAEARLQWRTPGNNSYVVIPTSQLFPN